MRLSIVPHMSAANMLPLAPWCPDFWFSKHHPAGKHKKSPGISAGCFSVGAMKDMIMKSGVRDVLKVPEVILKYSPDTIVRYFLLQSTTKCRQRSIPDIGGFKKVLSNIMSVCMGCAMTTLRSF